MVASEKWWNYVKKHPAIRLHTLWTGVVLRPQTSHSPRPLSPGSDQSDGRIWRGGSMAIPIGLYCFFLMKRLRDFCTEINNSSRQYRNITGHFIIVFCVPTVLWSVWLYRIFSTFHFVTLWIYILMCLNYLSVFILVIAYLIFVFFVGYYLSSLLFSICRGRWNAFQLSAAHVGPTKYLNLILSVYLFIYLPIWSLGCIFDVSLSVSPSIELFFYLPACMSVCLSICVYVVCVSVFMSFYLSIILSVCSFISVSAACVSVFMSVWLSVSPSIHVSVYLSVCLRFFLIFLLL